MLLSLNWLKDFVKISDKTDPKKIGEILTMHSVEVEGISKEAEKFNNFIVGEIVKIKKHPNADRLQIATVKISNKKNDFLNIVCGAPNIEVGQKVPLALAGAILPNGMEIKKTEVRGEYSEGMMCAQDELGIGDDHEGIMILDKKAKVGQSLSDFLKINDVVFEVENKTLSNRPDLWGHYGIARELGVLLDSSMSEKFKQIPKAKIKIDKKKIDFEVKVKDDKLCPRYMAIALSGIKIKESPDYIKKRLRAVGMRPINNIVDISNYVMLELGQPIHTFDLNLVNEITVRRAVKNETITTLDGAKRNLEKDMLVIADSKKPIAIAGVMGGENSEINDKTESVLIEVANFNPVSIRKTAQTLGLRTEASKRYEKSLDPNLCATAIARAVELIKESNEEAKVISQLVDVKKFNLFTGPLDVNMETIKKIIGIEIPEKEILRILKKLGFEVISKKDYFRIIIPTWRATKDISIAEDIAEEIARVYGYNKIKSALPEIKLALAPIDKKKKFERELKNILALSLKLTEVYNYSFNNDKQLKKMGLESDDYIRLANPISKDYTLLRQSLAPNILEKIKINQANYENINLFEIGKVYKNKIGENLKNNHSKDKLPLEEKIIGIAIAGNDNNLFRKTKGKIELLFSHYYKKAVYKKPVSYKGWAQKNKSADIFIDNKNIAYIAELNKKYALSNGIKKDLVLVEINFNDFFKVINSGVGKKYKDIPKFPAVSRDLAFVVDKKICYNDLKEGIVDFSELIRKVELFDIYEGDKIGEGKKSMAFHIDYMSNDKTLTAGEADELQIKLIKFLEKAYSIKIRD
jgi:phenylalanyl-tRNA synthetase beta chain